MGRPLLSHKSVRLLIIFTLACIISLPILRPFGFVTAQSPGQSQYYNTAFAWYYGGDHWTLNLSIPVDLYDAYVAVPDSVRITYSLADFGFFTTTEDNYMQNLANKLNQTATQQGYGSYDEVNFVLAFVQSIPYKTDNASTPYQDYPRFPIETLVDNVGDCKSHSILFATLMLILGYGAVFINPPDHLAVGILGNNLPGTSYICNNQTYYYCETTGPGFTIGQLPQQFTGQKVYVYPIDESEQYIPNLQATSSTVPNPTIQPVLPISVNLIADEPILFILIILAIVVSIAITVKTASKSNRMPPLNQTVSSETSNPKVAEANLEINKYKFCIYCGSSNKSFALYCEKCGKKIA